MAEGGTRPGGLTALAVISFIWALIEIVRGISGVASPYFWPAAIEQTEKAATRESDPKKKADLETALPEMRELNAIIQANRRDVMLYGGVKAFLGVVLVIAGIGYLGLRRFLGRALGLLYGATAVLWAVALIVYFQQRTGKSPGIMMLIEFVVPVATLFALLVPFKDDFTRP
jgi:hypothetical protein